MLTGPRGSASGAAVPPLPVRNQSSSAITRPEAPLDTSPAKAWADAIAQAKANSPPPRATVKPGDTLTGIADSHNDALPSVENADPQISNPNLIYPRQTVDLPKATPAEVVTGVHNSQVKPIITTVANANAADQGLDTLQHSHIPNSELLGEAHAQSAQSWDKVEQTTLKMLTNNNHSPYPDQVAAAEVRELNALEPGNARFAAANDAALAEATQQWKQMGVTKPQLSPIINAYNNASQSARSANQYLQNLRVPHNRAIVDDIRASGQQANAQLNMAIEKSLTEAAHQAGKDTKAQSAVIGDRADNIKLFGPRDPAFRAAVDNAKYDLQTARSTARQRQIDDWVNHHSDASGGFLGFGQTSAADHVREALDGKSKELGALSTDEQRYLLNKVLDRWSAGGGDGPGGAAELAQAVNGDRRLSGVVAEQLAAKSASLMQRPQGDGSGNDPHTLARAYALDAIQAASGDLGRTPASYSGLRQTMNSLGPQAAARFVQAVNPTAPGDSYFLMSQAQGRVLAAMNAGPQTQVTSAVVQTIFAQTTPGALNMQPAMQQDMAQALTREWYPDDQAKQVSERNRLAGILGTDQGQQLLFGSGNDGKIPLDARVNALAIIRTDHSIDAATLKQTGDPWSNPAILGPMARANAQQYLSLRGDQPQRLEGTDLDNTVGYAMGFAATVPRDASAAQATAAQGKFSYYAQGPGQKPVQAVVDQIRRLGGDAPKVTVLPIEYGSSDFGPVQLPLFRVQTATGDKYVDNTGRAYSSFEDWKNNNQLPPGTVFYPDQGHLTAGPGGTVKLASSNTPNTPDTTWKQIKGVLNDVALVGGIIAGGALIIGTDGLATPIVAGLAIGSGAWGAYTSGSELLDRAQHGQSINPLQDSTARGLWLSLAANTAGMGAFASEAALARVASSEGTLSSAAAWTIGTAKTVSNVTNAAAFANTGVDLAANWGAMTPAQRAQSVLSMGFWGATIAVGAKGVRSPGDLFNPAAMTRALSDAYQPSVTRTTALEGNRVEIVSDPQTGRPAILAGEQASAADIQLHVNVARMMARDQGLLGQIKALLGTREPQPGTLANSVKYESIKLNQKIATLQSRLAEPNLTAQQRSQIQGDIATTNAYLDQQLESLASIARSPGLAGVAAPSDGRAQAEQLPGLVGALENGSYAHQGYYFRVNPDDPELAPQVVRQQGYDSEHPQLAAYQKDNGTWGIKQVDSAPIPPDFRPIVDNTPSSLTLPKGLTSEQQTELNATLVARQKAVTARDAATDPATRNAEGYKVTVQSNLIGDIGARAYVQSEFPNAKPIYGGDVSRPGDFDRVYRQTLPDGKLRFIVVEAKGGNSPLGTKIVNGQVETQGTPAYFESTATSMSHMEGNAQSVGEELLSVFGRGRTLDGERAEVVYLVVRTPISTQGSTSHAGPVSAKQFDLTH
jgi:LysM repeat protein